MRSGVCAWVLVALAVAGASRGQERFAERIVVTEVEVPVRVLVKGRPVAGLTRADFEIYDRGELQSIVGFEVRALRDPVASGAAETGRPAALAAASRRLLLLIDFSFSRRQRLAAALEDLRPSLSDQLTPGDRLAVATYGGLSGLNLLVGFTEDREKIGLALDAVQAMLDADRKRQREILSRLHDARFSGTGEASTYRTLAEELGPAAALAVLSGPVVYDESEDAGVEVRERESLFGPTEVRVKVDVTRPIDTAQDVMFDYASSDSVRAFGLALAELGYLLRDVGGQKDVLFLSEGFSGGVLQNARSLFYLQKSLTAFRDSGWTFHGIAIGGVPGLDDATFAADSMLFLARGTGGDLVENLGDFSRATERILERTSIVYLLTFQPALVEGDDEYHKLEVKLKDPPRRVKIFHRPGYYPGRSAARSDVFAQRAEGSEWLLSNLESAELDVEVFAETVVDPLGGARVPVAVEIGGPSLLAASPGRAGRLELLLTVLDGDRQVREVLVGETTVRFRQSDGLLRRGGVRFAGELGLPPGAYRLRVLVRSHATGEVYLGTHELRVGPASAEPPALRPPPRDRSEAAWITVTAERRAAYFR